MTVAVGDVVEGVVTGVTGFGAFVKLKDGLTGLVHISEVANSYVKEIGDFLKTGDVVKVKVLSLGDDKKIALSIKQAIPKPKQEVFTTKPNPQKNNSFEDKLAEFLKDSNEKLVALKRHQEGRRR